jgi:hypothetical protein
MLKDGIQKNRVNYTVELKGSCSVRVSVTSVTSANESFDRKNSNIGYDLINNPYVSIHERVKKNSK